MCRVTDHEGRTKGTCTPQPGTLCKAGPTRTFTTHNPIPSAAYTDAPLHPDSTRHRARRVALRPDLTSPSLASYAADLVPSRRTLDTSDRAGARTHVGDLLTWRPPQTPCARIIRCPSHVCCPRLLPPSHRAGQGRAARGAAARADALPGAAGAAEGAHAAAARQVVRHRAVLAVRAHDEGAQVRGEDAVCGFVGPRQAMARADLKARNARTPGGAGAWYEL